MIRFVYPWEAADPDNRWSGITDDQALSRRRAASCLRAGATLARIEEEPTGKAWTGKLGGDGRVRWRRANPP
jgi:hypothetical protein